LIAETSNAVTIKSPNTISDVDITGIEKGLQDKLKNLPFLARRKIPASGGAETGSRDWEVNGVFAEPNDTDHRLGPAKGCHQDRNLLSRAAATKAMTPYNAPTDGA
jgi:hypothetical protein